MNLRLKNTIEDFNDHQYWGIKQSIKDGFIGFSPNSNTLRIVDSIDFKTITEIEYPSNFMFHYRNNKLKYVLNENEVHILDIAQNKSSQIFLGEKSDNTYLAFLSNSLLLEDVRIKEKRKLISKKLRIINLDNSEIKAQYDDDFEFLRLYDGNALFYHTKTHILENRSLHQKKTLWQIQLDGEPWIDYSLFDSNGLYLLINSSTLKYDLCKIDLTTGNIKWLIKDVAETTHLYNESLVQLGGCLIKIYDSKTGLLKEKQEILELKDNEVNVSSNLTDLENSVLYFTASIGAGENKRAFLGTIRLDNFDSHLYEVPFASRNFDMRSPIGRPFVNNKDIYIEIGHSIRRYNLE